MRRLLLVDDDKVDRLLVREMLSDDYSILEANTGEKAWDLIKENDVECVLLDYLIPGTDSLSLLQSFCERGIAVIMLTGEGNESIAVTAIKHGAQDYLKKNSLSAELLSRTILNAIRTIGFKRELEQRQREIVEANNQLKHRVAQLQELNEDLEELIHISAHDLKEPVKNLCGFCDLLGREIDQSISTKAKSYLDVIRRNARRLSLFIDELRALSRVGYQKIEPSEIDLNQVINEVIDSLQTQISARKVDIVIPQFSKIYGLKPLVSELFRNLLENALKYGSDNNLGLSITSEQSKLDNNEPLWIYGVRNSGVPIAAEEYSKIFQPFYRCASSRSLEGTGMGLTICKKIVERHGGRIWIDPKVTDGVHIKFHLGALEKEKGREDKVGG